LPIANIAHCQSPIADWSFAVSHYVHVWHRSDLFPLGTIGNWQSAIGNAYNQRL
jgi:hypothetical protein